MLKIRIISVGKFKEEYLRAACAEYAKRLSGYCTLEEIVLEPERLPDKPSAALVEKALSAEAEKIRKKIPAGAFTVALCIEGKQMSSVAFAELLQKQTLAVGQICLLIGSSYGLASTLKAAADYRLSMSEMTFPHQMAKIMLLEQLYRAFKINAGGTYHK